MSAVAAVSSRVHPSVNVTVLAHPDRLSESYITYQSWCRSIGVNPMPEEWWRAKCDRLVPIPPPVDIYNKIVGTSERV